jgi:hypothetical protein
MVHQYFSDKENGAVERNSEEISASVWDGIFAIYKNLLTNNKLSGKFSEQCEDGCGVCGCDSSQLEHALKAEIPKFDTPIQASYTDTTYSFSDSGMNSKTTFPEKYAILDFIEFLYKNIQDPIVVGDYHDFLRHNHYSFSNDGNAVAEFTSDINTIFERNGIIFYLDSNGQIKRYIPKSLRSTIEKTKHWLDQYPNSLKLYSHAIEKYENAKYPRNLLDDLRVSLETLIKELLKNQSSLENQVMHIGKYIKSKGGSKELTNMFTKLINYYASYQNHYVKHSSTGSIKEEEVEFIIELQYLRQFEFKPKNQISQLYESIGYSSKKTKKLPFFHLGEGIELTSAFMKHLIKLEGVNQVDQQNK